MRGLILAVCLVVMGGCSAGGVESNPAWIQHDLQLASAGKAKFIECRGACENEVCFSSCVNDVEALLDSWCQIYGQDDSRACVVLDDLVFQSQ